MNPWQKFFCASCQREKPISERRRVGTNLSRCKACAEKSRLLKAEKRDRGDFEPYETPTIPDEVMAAYREAME